MKNPVVTYHNTDLHKSQILKENRGKSGVYRWTNLLNGKCYVGSGANLSIRLSHYFSYQHMETQLKSRKSAIYSAILKYRSPSFKLEILEYCSSEDVLIREHYYIDLLKPKYNLLKTAGSWLGNKHSEESKAKMSETRKGTAFFFLYIKIKTFLYIYINKI
jgi:group I intron endonuclease